MNKPNIAGNKPVAIKLEQGRNYAWCACGLSGKQPFCDGSHKTTAFKPLIFTVPEPKTAYLCMCKQTKTPPFCDGTHNKL